VILARTSTVEATTVDGWFEGVALETPTTVLVVGGRPGAAYEPPPFVLDRTE
jgi:hypothetical protein